MRRDFYKRLIFSVRVSGRSMLPILSPRRVYWATCLRRPKIGDIVIFHPPKTPDEIYIKRIVAKVKNGFTVSGMHIFSTKSQDIGTVPRSAILGTLLRYKGTSRQATRH